MKRQRDESKIVIPRDPSLMFATGSKNKGFFLIKEGYTTHILCAPLVYKSMNEQCHNCGKLEKRKE